MDTNFIIVGAGLSGLIAAWRILDVHKNVTVTIVDQAASIAGDHTWSFNQSDIAPDLQDWLAPFIAHRWEKYQVKFPRRNRMLGIPYCTGNSESLRAAVQPLIESGQLKLQLGTRAAHISETAVQLEGGQKLTADCVLDARGFMPRDDVYLGYQKFVGHTIKTLKPHSLSHPVIMDATVEQIDGYRFVYCLPFSETEILVEDTYYTDGPELSEAVIAKRLASFITAQGWGDHELVRQERGVLPITLAVADRFNGQPRPDGATPIGIRGGYYHAVTGYSLPEAVKTANLIATLIAEKPDDFPDHINTVMWEHGRDHFNEEKFLRLLNRMLFRAAKPAQRYKVLQRFYGLPEGLIKRFYRNRLTKADKLRILAGKPPVPIGKALSNVSEAAFIKSNSAS